MEKNEFSKEPQHWKKLESNNKAIAPNVSFSQGNCQEIKQVYISKSNLEPKNKLILLIMSVKNVITLR